MYILEVIFFGPGATGAIFLVTGSSWDANIRPPQMLHEGRGTEKDESTGKAVGGKNWLRMEPGAGIEPATSSLQNWRSTN